VKKTDLAYIAGLFDGEGCIQIVKQKRPEQRNYRSEYSLRCSLEMANEYLPRLLHMHFGGSLRRRNLPLPRQNQWEWTVRSNVAALFLKDVYPYIILKKGEADVALKFQEAMHTIGVGRKRLTEEETAIREAQHILLSNMKKKT